MQVLPFKAAAAVAVEINDAGHEFARPDEWLVVAALQFELLLVLDLDVGALDLQSSRLEHLRTLVVCDLPSCSMEYSALGGRIMALHSCS